MKEGILGFPDLFLILSGIIMGTIARLITLKIDTRQNPSYPNGYFINIIMGFIASCLGAVAIPALLTKNFTAVTFLTLAVQHFREVRKTERESLVKLESVEYARRGEAYMDGIAKTYEARNYLSMLVALLTVLTVKIVFTDSYIINAAVAAVTGLAVLFLLARFTKGKKVGDICTLTLGEISIDRSDLYVDGMFVTGVLGTDRARELFLREGIALVLQPKKEKFGVTLDNLGQRQAMLFEATRSFGVKRFSFTRRSFKEGKLIIAFVPIIRNPEGIMRVIRDTPVLENSRKIHSIMSGDLGEVSNGKGQP